MGGGGLGIWRLCGVTAGDRIFGCFTDEVRVYQHLHLPGKGGGIEMKCPGFMRSVLQIQSLNRIIPLLYQYLSI